MEDAIQSGPVRVSSLLHADLKVFLLALFQPFAERLDLLKDTDDDRALSADRILVHVRETVVGLRAQLAEEGLDAGLQFGVPDLQCPSRDEIPRRPRPPRVGRPDPGVGYSNQNVALAPRRPVPD